jgi:hypothetical protein
VPLAEDELLQTLTRVATTLDAAGIAFAVTGGAAVYAHGGPMTRHDLDVLIRSGDADAAVRALVEAGLRTTRENPENWLDKAWDGDVLVDLIHRPNERPVTDEVLARATDTRVGPALVPVLPATDVVVDKLLVLGPHRCDFTELLPIVRAVREQLDWAQIRAETADSPYAEAFLLLADRLGLCMAPDQGAET